MSRTESVWRLTAGSASKLLEETAHDNDCKEFPANTTNANDTIGTTVPEINYIVAALAPKYRLGRCLGEPGAFGSVHSLQDRLTGEKFASKVLKIPDRSSNHYDKLMEMYTKEIEILGCLNHPGTVRIERVLKSSTHLFILMERCSGGDLFDYIGSRGGKLVETDAARIFRQVLLAVEYLHDVASISHNDIKLANIMFKTKAVDSPVKLIDFGLSEHCQAGEILTSRSGTTAFMAPEQIQQRYSQQVDMWSLGVVLYIMLFGYSPWDPFCSLDSRAIEGNVLKGFTGATLSGYGPWFPKSIAVSSEAKALMVSLMRYMPSQRLSAHDALDHPWLRKFDAAVER